MDEESERRQGDITQRYRMIHDTLKAGQTVRQTKLVKNQVGLGCINNDSWQEAYRKTNIFNEVWH